MLIPKLIPKLQPLLRVGDYRFGPAVAPDEVEGSLQEDGTPWLTEDGTPVTQEDGTP